MKISNRNRNGKQILHHICTLLMTNNVYFDIMLNIQIHLTFLNSYRVFSSCFYFFMYLFLIAFLLIRRVLCSSQLWYSIKDMCLSFYIMFAQDDKLNSSFNVKILRRNNSSAQLILFVKLNTFFHNNMISSGHLIIPYSQISMSSLNVTLYLRGPTWF